jgi:ribosomal protein S6E (S10)
MSRKTPVNLKRMPENSLFRTFCRFILATVILFNTLNVPLGYAAYSAFSASDYAAPRAGGTANMRSVMWNKVVDNVDDIQTRLLNFSFSSGNVGIGTATPGAKLEVAGQVKITGGTPGAGKALVSDATGLASWSASAPLYAETDPKVGANVANYISKWNGSALVAGIIYDNATNVGIGTATPGYKLDVVGTSNFSQKLTAPYGSVNSTAGYSWTDAAINTTSIEIVNNAATVATSSPTLAFHRYGTGGPQFRLDPAGTNVLYLESANAASARKPNAYGGGANSYFTRFHVDGQLSTSGNVGIGTTTPGAKLEVAGQVKITGGTPGVGKVLTSDATGLASWSASAPVYTEVDPKVGANTTNYVSKWNGSALVAGTVFDNGTNVGIGTATPNEKFDVNGAIQFRGTSAGYATTQSVGMIDFYNAGSRFLSFGANGTTRGIFSWYQAGQNNALGQEAMRIDANGNLGVGTTVPGAKLEVAGQVKITGGTPGAGKVLTSDATGLASWSASAPLYSYTETDPQVGANTANYVPKWDGTALVAGTVFDNGTNVGIGNAAPSHKLDVTGNIRHTGRIINNAGIKTYAVSVGSQGNVNSTYELMRIGRDSANWSWKMPYEITVYNTYYRGSVTKWIVNYNQVDAGSAVATESNGLLPLKLYLGAEVSVSGTIYYRPVLIDLPNYQAMSVEVKYNTADVASITGDGQVQFTGTISVGTGTNYNGSVQLATSGGNVGIGTATPATKLDVQGGVRIGASTDYSASLSIQNNGNGGIRMFGDANGLTNSHLYMANAANNKAASMMMNNADGRFSIFNYSGAWNERLTLTAGGNFGIGTTSPLANLDVAGNIGLGVRSVGTSRYIGKYVETTGAFGGNSGWIGFIGSGSDEYISFGTLHSGVGGGERMRIDRAGNVGIGTTAP